MIFKKIINNKLNNVTKYMCTTNCLNSTYINIIRIYSRKKYVNIFAI